MLDVMAVSQPEQRCGRLKGTREEIISKDFSPSYRRRRQAGRGSGCWKQLGATDMKELASPRSCTVLGGRSSRRSAMNLEH